jgi:hypothetical protein
MNLIKKEKLLYKVKYMSLFIVKLSLFLLIISGIIFSLYKLFKWNKIFDENFKKSEALRREIVLPVILGEIFNENKESNISYENKIWLESFVNKLKKSNIKVSKIEFKDFGDYNLYTVNGTFIKINVKNDIEKSWNNFISSYTKQAIKDNELESLEYIDIRFKNKIFYRLKNINIGVETSTENTLKVN